MNFLNFFIEKILKNQEDGTVIQRFCIAILQKMSVPKHPDKIKVPWEIEQLSKMGCSEMICPKCKKSPMILLNVCSPQKSRDGPVKTDLAA